jgi:hypothetical protein
LVTVAFAALNFVIYLLWWDKPQNVQRGVRVYRKRITEEPIDDGDVEWTVGFWVALGDALSDIPAAIVRGPVADTLWGAPWAIRVLMWLPMKPTNIMIPGDESDAVELKRVGTFYPAKWVASKKFSIFLVATITVAFGAIHSLGWSFEFRSIIERALWRVASLSITGVPIMIFVLYGLVSAIKTSFVETCAFIAVILIVFLYILSRLVLLVLPFLCLGSLPPATFHIVHWTSFIPHI